MKVFRLFLIEIPARRHIKFILEMAVPQTKKEVAVVSKKTFILDTNVLIHDPESILKFEENDVVIPISTIEELDELKRGQGEIPYSARHALKLIDSLRANGNADAQGQGLHKGVPIPNGAGGRLIIELNEPLMFHKNSADNRIISIAADMHKKNNPTRVVLVSKDAAVRIKAESLGVTVQDYKNDKTSIFRQYGRVLSSEEELNGISSVRYVKDGDVIVRVNKNCRSAIKRGKKIEGIAPKNLEQECAIDALLNPDINVVALTGKAGSGKTLLSLAAALHQTTKQNPLYEQVLVARPVVSVGNDIGYLPGDVGEKLRPYMQPIFDNLEVILETPRGMVKDKQIVSKYKSYQYLLESGILQVEPLTYIRGRSLPLRYFIVDEAQNLRPIDVKTIITRCGEGTKIVFTGDVDQIDSPFLDSFSNGLSYLISKFIDLENFCYLSLGKSARSQLADIAADIL